VTITLSNAPLEYFIRHLSLLFLVIIRMYLNGSSFDVEVHSNL